MTFRLRILTLMLRCSRHFLSTLVLVSAIATAHAAELGEARVSSHIGQPLVADIELTMLDDPAQAVAVRLASPEVYNGAGIAMPPVLASLNLSVMRRDGRQFLHVTSLRPVDSEHLHLYLELAEKGQRSVRLATLWLTPDPHPGPAPVPVPAPAPVPATVPAPALASAVHAEAAAAPVRTAASMPRPAAEVRKPMPAAEAVHARPKAPAAAPLPIHTAQPAAPAACAVPADQAKVCAALDGKNAALKAQLGALEGKVKSLQATLGAAPAPAPVATHEPAPTPTQASAPAHEPAPAPEAAPKPAGPKPISAIKPLVPRKPKAPPEPDTGLPWGWIGAGAALLLALAGAAMLLRRRARTVRNVDIPAEPHPVERLRQRFFSRSKEAPNPASKAAPEAVEPSLE
jgi:hypothetical protein